jgi:transposase, IS30 family
MNQYKQLTYPDMIKIETYLEERVKPVDIAIKIGKHKTTIYRHLCQNSHNGKYRAKQAWEKIKERQSRANSHPRILSDGLLEKYIVEKLETYWSPEQIAGKWKRDTGEALSHETIYKYIYEEKPQLVALYFRRKGKKYSRKRKNHSKVAGMRSIDDRPNEVNERKEFGHWEGDTITDRWQSQGIVTNVERKSGVLVASKVSRRTASEVYDVTEEDFSSVPAELRVSITYDRGSEFLCHKAIEATTKMTVYFAHAYSPWERATNENTNGLLRQFIPKTRPLKDVSEKELDEYVSLLNNRPRKRLNYQTPLEFLRDRTGVALDSGI